VIRIPPHSLDRARKLALQSWVGAKKFPRDYYFGLVDPFREKLKERAPDGTLDEATANAAVAMMLGGALDSEGALLAYAMDKGTVDIEDPNEWLQIIIAGGWCVLQRYEREMNDG
jgi:hypothetical protein